MWVIANGAPKSGSTWLFQLMKATREFSPLPEEFQDSRWSNQSVNLRLLQDAMATLPAQDARFATKQHWPNPSPLFGSEAQARQPLLRTYRDYKYRLSLARQNRLHARLLSTPGIKICNIIRDVRDVVVSLYHHQVRLSLFEGDMESFLRCNGALVVRNTVSYHRYWIQAPHRTQSNYFMTAYEYLSDDTSAAARSLFDFLGLSVSDEQRESVVQATSFDSKRSKGPGMFFRKGRAFAFDEELTGSQADQILEAADRHGLAEVKKAIGEFNPALVPYLEVTDVGLPSAPGSRRSRGTG